MSANKEAAQSPSLKGEPSEEDYRRADEFIRRANARDGISPERREALSEFRRVIARSFQAERQGR
jgi:hypothetical protein